jgi:peptide/nickel transport system substrate-binding protein
MRSRWIAGVVAVATAVGLAGCGTAAEPDGPSEIRIGVSPDQLSGVYDVVIRNLYALDMKAVYDPLFQVDTVTNDLVPGLATGYEQNDDWREVTITLRDGVTFTDGEELTAQGVVDYFNALAARADWWQKAQWDTYSPTVEVVDDMSFKISSDTPMDFRSRGLLYELFRSTPIVSPAVVGDLDSLTDKAVGAGAYIVDKATVGVSVTLTRNPDYWDQDSYPYDTMILNVYADDVAALNALKADQIDATRLTNQLAADAEAQGFVLNEGLGRFTAMYVADREGTLLPPVADQRVRQAMALAFDREQINETLNQGYGTVTSQPFHPSLPEYVEGGDDMYPYDPDQARELMAEAGYADGFDVTLPTTPFLNINQWDAVVQQYLGDIGIRVTYKNYSDTGEYFTALIAGEYPLFYYSEVFVQALPVFMTPEAIFNVFIREGDQKITDLWKTVQQAGDQDEADAAAQELGQYIMDEAFLVPFAAVDYLWLSKEGISVNVGSSGENIRPFDFQPSS